ncbi:MAG: hypothetical protein MRERV_14c064 [Mycoplasmataceae bacterium RV_VA103A]|nr:MAG: hypothetical protein MRERV_14c064 [Mycoplasmataceae bacterium RV_VA103A]
MEVFWGLKADSFIKLKYRFRHEGCINKCFFKREGVYSSEWEIKGNIWEIKDELWKLENGEKISVVRLNQWGNYERHISKEEEIKRLLREDVREFELAIKDGKPMGGEKETRLSSDDDGTIPMTQTSVGFYTIYACPKQTHEKGYCRD